MSDETKKTLDALRAAGEDAWHLGQIVDGPGEVQYL